MRSNHPPKPPPTQSEVGDRVTNRDTSGRFTLQALCDEFDVTPRTVRYYVARGILPPAEGSGPGAHYGAVFADRLRLVLRLRHEMLPLAEIRRRLGRLSDTDVRQALAASAALEMEPALAGESSAAPLGDGQGVTEGGGSALDYIDTVLGGSPYTARRAVEAIAAGIPTSSPTATPTHAMAAVLRRTPTDALPHLSADMPGPPSVSTWRRYRVTSDIEIQACEPLDRRQRDALQKLLQYAKTLFAGGAQ